jgi:hypothetical protein
MGYFLVAISSGGQKCPIHRRHHFRRGWCEMARLGRLSIFRTVSRDSEMFGTSSSLIGYPRTCNYVVGESERCDGHNAKRRIDRRNNLISLSPGRDSGFFASQFNG